MAGTSGVRAGIDVGGTKCCGVLARPDGTIVAEIRRPTPTRAGELTETVVAMTRALWSHGSHDAVAAGGDGLRTVGVGVPGMVNRHGVLEYAPNLHAADGLDVAHTVAAALDIEPSAVTVENDNTCATWAEHLVGAGQGVADMLFVALGTGIGGGLITNGQLVRGHHGYAGELGHFCINPDGPPCPCGQRGCWERYASGAGLAALARDAATRGELDSVLANAGGDPEQLRGEHVTAAAQRGDAEAQAVMETFARWVGLGLAGLVAITDPGLVVLGGGLSASADTWLPRTQWWFTELTEGARHRHTRLVPAVLGEQAAAVGAALLAPPAVSGPPA